jgi:hypothetical protein
LQPKEGFPSRPLGNGKGTNTKFRLTFIRCFPHCVNLVCQCFLKGYQDPARETKSSTKKSSENDKGPAKKKQKPQPLPADPQARYPLTMLRDIVVKIRSSFEFSQKYQNLATSLGLSGERPPLDVVTRWNSTFVMLNHGLKYKKAISLLISAQEWTELAMTEEDWKELEVLQSNT